jgi:hypothetical protein
MFVFHYAHQGGFQAMRLADTALRKFTDFHMVEDPRLAESGLASTVCIRSP